MKIQRDLPVLLPPVFMYLHMFIYAAKMTCSTSSDPTFRIESLWLHILRSLC